MNLSDVVIVSRKQKAEHQVWLCKSLMNSSQQYTLQCTARKNWAASVRGLAPEGAEISTNNEE